MNDDWRLHVVVHADGITRPLSERLGAGELEHDLETSFEQRVIVSIHGSDLYCYTDTREQAERAQELIRSVASDHGWRLDYELHRWHPSAEEWKDPDAPLPSSDAERAAEHEQAIAGLRAEAAEHGYPDYEVRVGLKAHTETVALSHRLDAEALRHVRRWRYVLLGATDEDSAEQLAERVRGLAPAGATVTVEQTQRGATRGNGGNPFAILGGLGG